MRSICTLSFFAAVMLLGCVGALKAAQGTNPGGSYQQTCSDISVRKGTLYAKCKDDKGKPRSSRLNNYEKCASDIANNHGNLDCTGGEGTVSRGSYTGSCRSIYMRGTTLYATCKSLDGRELPVSLKDANSCSEGVANINGILNCQVSDILPPGSYIATCKDVRLQGTTLLASCNDGKNHWVNASLRDANRCNGDIANLSGVLRCATVQRR